MAPADHALHRLLVLILLVHQGEKGEERHLHLLGRRQPRGMVQCNAPAVRDQAVDEPQLAGIDRERAVALVEHLAVRLRQCRNLRIEHVVFMECDHPQTPSGGPEIFRERVQQNGILRAQGKQRDEVVGKGGVDIIGQDDQVPPMRGDDLVNLVEAGLVDLDGRGIAGIDEKKYLDLGVKELVELAVGILPARFGIRLDRQLDEPIIVQLGISI